MFRMKVTFKGAPGVESVYSSESSDFSQIIAVNSVAEKWGKPERWVLHKDESLAEAYDEADVIEEIIEEVRPAIEAVVELVEEAVEAKEAVYRELSPAQPPVTRKMVKLRAEYTVSVEDITQEHNLQQAIMKRKAEYPSAEEFMNAFFDGGEDAIAALQEKRLQIKAKYPKP